MARPLRPNNQRGIWNRTNHVGNRGFKDNTPGAWVDTNGPVWWFGDDRAYIGGTANGASAITKATSIIVNRLAASEWTTTRGDRYWLVDPMNTRGDRRSDDTFPDYLKLPRSFFYGQWIRSALLYGMGYFIYRAPFLANPELLDPPPRGDPKPGSFLLLDPRCVEHVDTGGPSLQTRIVTPEGQTFDVARNGNVQGYSDGDYRLATLRNPLLPINYETGTTPGVLQYHALELGLQTAIADYTSGVFTGSGVPSGYLKNTGPQLTPERADAIKQEWVAGQRGGRTVGILSAALEYSAVAVSPVDAALADMTKLSLVSVANAFCVPLYMLGAPSGDSMTYSNVAMEDDALWTHTLYAWRAALVDTLNAHLPYGSSLVILGGSSNGGNGSTGNGTRQAPSDVPQG